MLLWKRLFWGGIVLVVFFWLAHQAITLAQFALAPADPASQEEIFFEVHRKQTPREIVLALEENKLISDSALFHRLGRITRQWKDIKAGEYKLSAKMSPIEIFSVITSGISVALPLTLREGENMYELADNLQNKGLADRTAFLRLCRDKAFMSSLGFSTPLPPSLEGYLFPDTYFFQRTTTPEELIRQMVKNGQSIWGEKEEHRARELGLTRHQVMTLASMIEKETGAQHERPLISSVFHNRLKKNMRLQSDPTTIYGIWEKFRGNLRKSDLLTATPYNTYVIPALPVGPIGNPGREAIQAALFPDTSDYLFFVSHNDGTHEFTRSFGEHARAVRKFQLDPKARQGKSWRDLQQK